MGGVATSAYDRRLPTFGLVFVSSELLRSRPALRLTGAKKVVGDGATGAASTGAWGWVCWAGRLDALGVGASVIEGPVGWGGEEARRAV